MACERADEGELWNPPCSLPLCPLIPYATQHTLIGQNDQFQIKQVFLAGEAKIKSSFYVGGFLVISRPIAFLRFFLPPPFRHIPLILPPLNTLEFLL